VAKRVTKTKRAKAPPSRKGKKPRDTSGLVPFRKGERRVGRTKGTKNKFGVRLKEAILEAAERSGRDGKGKDGAEPAVFGRMLEKVMPLQIDVKDKTDRMSPQEAVDRLRERGLPVPDSLNSLAQSVGRAVAERQENDYDAELNGEDPEEPDEQEEAA
jgi:hypothetical protein